MYRISIFLFAFLSVAVAQTTTNPDFSIIGQTMVRSDEDTTIVNGANMELAVTGYLNPYARAEVYLHKHDTEAPFEVEEAVVSIERGLPFGLALRVGKLRPTFGKINRQHDHIWPYAETPAAIAQFAGEELWSSHGVETSWLMPLPWYSQLSATAVTSGMAAAEHHHDEADTVEDPAEGKQQPAYCLRSGHFFDLTPVLHLDVGASYYQESVTDASLAAFDYKLKWQPNTYKGFILQGDLYLNMDKSSGSGETELEHELPELGSYTYLDYRFNKRWNLGGLLDIVKHHEEDPDISPAVFMGFSPVEETLVWRLVLKDQVVEQVHNTTTLVQLIWSLGPHKPHQF